MFYIVIFSILIFCLIYKINFLKEVDINGFLNKDFTYKVRGLAILFVLLQHCNYFIFWNDPFGNSDLEYYEKVIHFILSFLTTIGVGLFLFLSGYGNRLSAEKGCNFRWLEKRCLRIYAIAFLILCVSFLLRFFLPIYSDLFPKWYSFFVKLFKINLSFGIYWYIKAQLICYLSFFVFFKYLRKHYLKYLFSFWIIWVLVCISIKTLNCWYITILCFPFGCFCAEYKDKFVNYVYNKNILKISLYTLLVIALMCSIAFIFKTNHSLFILISLLSCVLLMLLSVRIKSDSKILEFFGKYSLEIYLLHGEFIYLARRLQFGFNNEIYLKIFLIVILTLCLVPLLQKFY